MDKKGKIHSEEEEMKESPVKFVFVLSVICLFSAALLSMVYAKTQPILKQQQKEQESEAMKYVLPSAESFKYEEACGLWQGLDKDGNVAGYCFKAEEKGYSSVIKMMIGIDKDFRITGIKVLSQNETPGLGTRIIEVKADQTLWDVLGGKANKASGPAIPWFLKQFYGKTLDNINEVETISGATISSSAVVRAVKRELENIKECVLNKEN